MQKNSWINFRDTMSKWNNKIQPQLFDMFLHEATAIKPREHVKSSSNFISFHDLFINHLQEHANLALYKCLHFYF